jgi:hypothetical protein
MKVLVTGDREWTDRARLEGVLDGYPVKVVVEGCARGADRMAEEWATSRGVTIDHHPADWARLHRAAGPIRNREMALTKPDLVIAFHYDLTRSKGTADMVARARRSGIPVVVVS